MIFGNTGQPGAGKTIFAIHFVLNDDQFKNRQVYTYGIKGINVPNWIEIDKEQVLTWWTLPEGSVVIIDECQDIFRPRPTGSKVPEHVQRLEKHRHLGFDFVLTFQFGRQIDTVVRELITDHFHYHRVFGLDSTTQFYWDKLNLDPSSPKQQKLGRMVRRSFPKDVYQLYESASLHTAKKRLPKIIYLLPFSLGGLGIALYLMLSGYFSDNEQIPIQNPSPEQSLSDSYGRLPGRGSSNVTTQSKTIETLKYLEKFIPRVAGLAETAPIYDSIRLKAVSVPRPQCAVWTEERQGYSSCRCYSQQVTYMREIDDQQCRKIVRGERSFDHTIPDYEQKQGSESVSDGFQPAHTSEPSGDQQSVAPDLKSLKQSNFQQVVSHPSTR